MGIYDKVTGLLPYRVIQVAVVIGLIHLVKCTLALLSGVWKYFLRPRKDLKQYGQWAGRLWLRVCGIEREVFGAVNP